MVPASGSTVLVVDDEWGQHADFEKWLETSPPQAPISRYQLNRTGQARCASPLACFEET